MRNSAVKAVEELAKRDRNVILVSGDLGFGVLDEFRNHMPDQYFNAGICEQNMASMAAGLALEGKHVYTYSIGNFPTLRCVEQIRNDICYHNADVTILAVGGGFAYGSLGMSHHATEDIAIMRSLPNMNVFTPADAIEAKAVVYKAAGLKAPCYIRLNKGGEPLIHRADGEMEEYQVGQAVRLTDESSDICLMSVGAVAVEAIKAAQDLQAQGIGLTIYSFPSVKPIDVETIRKCAARYRYIITIEEHNIIGGFGSAVAEVLAEEPKGAILVRIGLKDIYSSAVGSQAYLRHVYGLDSEAVKKKVLEVL